MDSIDNVNHVLIIVGHYIFDLKYKKASPLPVEYLNIICSSSDGEKIFALFGTVLYAVRYIKPKSKRKRGHNSSMEKISI